jgi:secreted trypsin-like serine protease
MLVCLAIPAAASAQPDAKTGNDIKPRIIGGFYPSANFIPGVTFISDGRGYCTATLIAPQRVLTAAHCVKGSNPSDFYAYVGARNVGDPYNPGGPGSGQKIHVHAIAIHPAASLPENAPYAYHAYNDLAVMFLDQPSSVQPVQLGDEDDWGEYDGNGYLGTALGWGHTNPDHDNPVSTPALKAVTLYLASDAFCAQYMVGDYNPSIHMCAYDASGQNCETHGDSGGPMMVYSGGAWKEIGILSFYPNQQGAIANCVGVWLSGYTWVAGDALRGWPLSVADPNPLPGEGGVAAGVAGSESKCPAAQRQAHFLLRRFKKVRKRSRSHPHAFAKKLRSARRAYNQAVAYQRQVCGV